MSARLSVERPRQRGRSGQRGASLAQTTHGVLVGGRLRADVKARPHHLRLVLARIEPFNDPRARGLPAPGQVPVVNELQCRPESVAFVSERGVGPSLCHVATRVMRFP
jgi:hypothetical protein